MSRICVYCGSADGTRPDYRAAAERVGRTLARRGLGLVYGGASVGTMGAMADAALDAGGEVTGIIPRSLVDREVAHPELTELHVVEGMHERKALMTALSDAFLTLPGGHGTLDELFECVTWKQLGLHDGPIGLWNVAGYWDPLLAMLARAGEEGFVRPAHRGLLIAGADLDDLLARLTG
ncbi:MAG TPA: TIGR00730 family Rossman fold protein [Sandaracinaceae bacterium LLY-WYZ-13_1]|nr:TIGR00730 family Rossman fold protein [Sandaracinaceae bacterium LLY-WYZ-13_1]